MILGCSKICRTKRRRTASVELSQSVSASKAFFVILLLELELLRCYCTSALGSRLVQIRALQIAYQSLS